MEALEMSPEQSSAVRRDRRVLRTREALRGALLALMVERGWDAIDVQSLCERANIGRSTFYLHFPNKEDLLRSSFGDLQTMLLGQTAKRALGSSKRLVFVGALIAHVHEQQLAFRAILDRRSGHFVQDRFRDMLVDLVEAERPQAGRRTWQALAASHFLAGALFQMLVWWLGASRPHRPQDVEALFHALSEPVLRSLEST
jgi:AcrR family transcriptional regulator